MEVKTLIGNLTDSGCSAEGTRRAKALYEAGEENGGCNHDQKGRTETDN